MHENLILERLQRMESRLVRGFSEMGVREPPRVLWRPVGLSQAGIACSVS
jgi:hypothetical protein